MASTDLREPGAPRNARSNADPRPQRKPDRGRSAKTPSGIVRRTVGTGSVITSLAVYTALYGTLAVVEVGLLLKYAKAGVPEVQPPPERPESGDRPLAFAY